VDRRQLLDTLDIAGPHWQVPPHFTGGGKFALDTAKEQGLPGVIAKRLDSAYGDGWLRLRR
jgi:bifunctional non-homologous end joining protein LigD